MKDTDFFERALELKSPWFVEAVKMDVQAKRVEVIIGCRSKAWGDPQSAERLHIHGYEKRRWRHLDTMQFETVLVANVPRVKYPDGHTELVSVPWAQPHGRFTLMFEGWAIAVLRATRTVSDACVLLNLSWDTAQTIMEGAVKRGIEGREVQNIQRVGIDEKSFGRGQDYISVLTDLDHGRVIEVAPGRDKGAACSLFKTLAAQELEKVQAVAMDMSETFAAAAREMAPKADIVYDRFHVSQALNQAVDQVRRAENKALLAEGDERLKGTRQTWLFNPRNLQDDRLKSLSDLARQNLKTSRAWLHKENFEGFWDMESRWHGQRYLRDWYNSAIRSRLEPIKRVARTLKAHSSGLINYFTHHITNAVTEGLNSRIQDLKSAARGFRNFHHYRIRILFFCGKLDLQPVLSA